MDKHIATSLIRVRNNNDDDGSIDDRRRSTTNDDNQQPINNQSTRPTLAHGQPRPATASRPAAASQPANQPTIHHNCHNQPTNNRPPPPRSVPLTTIILLEKLTVQQQHLGIAHVDTINGGRSPDPECLGQTCLMRGTCCQCLTLQRQIPAVFCERCRKCSSCRWVTTSM